MVHNFYKQSGGEDNVFFNEYNLLISNGHEVEKYSVSNDSINESNLIGKVITGLNSVWSLKSYKDFCKVLSKFRPDVVHFHNFFPLISPSAYKACKKYNIPVVQTIHNYRLLCPAGTFMRNGEVCELCLQDSLANAVRYRCYRDSLAQTLPVVAMIEANKLIGTWDNDVNKYICLSEFAKNKFVEGGFSQDKIEVKPNFYNGDKQKVNLSRKKTFVFVGRISKEKGLDYLLKAWKLIDKPSEFELIVIGDGPEKEKLIKKYENHSDIVFLGKQPADVVMKHVNETRALIVPSIWYEGFPMTIVEAFSKGTPVIASDIGTMSEIIENGKNGLKFEVKEEKKLQVAIEQFILMKNSELEKIIISTEEIYAKKYSKEINYHQLIKIYNEVL